MQKQDLIEVKGSNLVKAEKILLHFNEKYSKCFGDSLEIEDWEDVWNSFFSILNDAEKTSLYANCLSCVRILTRDTSKVPVHVSTKHFETLLRLCNLHEKKVKGHEDKFTEVTIESLKCLCNIVYLSPQCRKHCLKNNVAAEGIIQRIKWSSTSNLDIALYDMKLLFLITALESSSRTKIRDDLNGMVYLTEWLNDKITNITKDPKELELISEILKLMFNIISNPDKSPDGNENEIQYRHITLILRNLIHKYGAMSNDSEKQIIMHSINLLSNISTACMVELVNRIELSNDDGDLFEGKCIGVLRIIFVYLQKVLTDGDQISPVLTVLVKCARSDKVMRHYIRQVVLPPLQKKDLIHRPEEGNDLRGHFVRFLSTGDSTIRFLAADLLFVCCKENVNRMIKYTGFGNAAGLLASKGMLDCRKTGNTDYSSESDGSDTEDYKSMFSDINPILGCYDPVPKLNPLEGMTEDQKEYEAEQLANLMDKLHRQGIIQPCRIGEDGTPQPVEHILELQEEMHKHSSNSKSNN